MRYAQETINFLIRTNSSLFENSKAMKTCTLNMITLINSQYIRSSPKYLRVDNVCYSSLCPSLVTIRYDQMQIGLVCDS